MSSKGKIGLIGRVDPERTLFDGQTVKTRMMYQLLCSLYGEQRIQVVDTLDWRHRWLQVFAGTCRCLRDCDRIVILLSRNGRRVLYPCLARTARRKGAKVYQNLIGGRLDDDLDEYPRWAGYLNAFEVNWVESHELVRALSARGVTNAVYLPNFKYLDVPDISDARQYGYDWRFCIFSRVIKEKGVSDAVEAVEVLNREGGEVFSLDIYGPIDDGYRDEFDQLLAVSPHCAYKGSIAPEKSISTVMRYDALLFPTKWVKEGIPGTIIDALSAGVPIIGAKWQYYSEMLEDGATGFGYQFGHNELLDQEIQRFVGLTDDERNAMRHECLRRARAYTPQVVAEEVRRVIGE